MAMLRWYELRSKTGSTISIKARSEAEAVDEAADRWNCDEDEIICTGHKPYNTYQAARYRW